MSRWYTIREQEQECYTATEPDEAIEDYLDSALDRPVNEWPRMITLEAYAPKKLSKSIRDCCFDHAFDAIFYGVLEEYINPEEDLEITDAMCVALRTGIDSMLDQWTPWACDLESSEEIDVMAWVLENRPDWLKGQSNEL